MDRIVGALFGLVAGGVVVALGIRTGGSLGDASLRALCAVLVGYGVGRIVFGPVGRSVVKEAAGPLPPPAGEARQARPPSKAS